MKNFSACVVMLLAVACSPGTASETTSDSTLQASVPTEQATPTTFVNWNEVGVRDSPSEKGKYITTVYLAETLELLGDTASEVSGKTRVHYNKVRLLDGKECWIRTDFIAIDSKAAALLQTSNIFSRPNRVAVTGKQFEEYDVIAVKPVEGKQDWFEAKGKAIGENWFTHGYIVSDGVLTDETEVQFAALKKRAATTKDQKMREALEEQLMDPQFQNTAQYAKIFGPYKPEDAGVAGDYSEEGDGESDVTAVVNVYLLGKWKKVSVKANNETETEEVEITSEYDYIVTGFEQTMLVTEIGYDPGQNLLSFVITLGGVRVHAEVTPIDSSTLKGIEADENGGTVTVTYTRVE